MPVVVRQRPLPRASRDAKSKLSVDRVVRLGRGKMWYEVEA